MTDETEYPTLGVRDVARLLNRSPRLVYSIKARDLPYTQLGTNAKRAYRVRDLAAYIERNTVRE